MSIIIHGLNVPLYEDVIIRISTNGEYRGYVTSIVYDNPDGGFNGKVEQLPPHGRLIDADALTQNYEDLYGDSPFDLELIASAPTIIEAEEKDG